MAVVPWRLVVAPHPDDEGQVLPLLAEPAAFTVIATLSQGEATSRRRTRPASHALRGFVERTAHSPVAVDRVLSWHAFLDSECGWLGIDHSRDLVPTDEVTLVGTRSARVALALPDGALDPHECLAAIVSLLPTGVPTEVVLAAYDSAPVYQHRDHATLGGLASRIPADRVLVRAPNGTVRAQLSTADFERLFAAETGSFQRAYGWLAPDRAAWSTAQPALFGRRAEFTT